MMTTKPLTSEQFIWWLDLERLHLLLLPACVAALAYYREEYMPVRFREDLQ